MFPIIVQSWLISLFLACPPNMGFICPSATAKKVDVPSHTPRTLDADPEFMTILKLPSVTAWLTGMHPPTFAKAGAALSAGFCTSQAVENAIREGIIYWHAFPYNGQLELMDERHVRESVQLTHDLDAKYGYKPKITLSQVCR